MSKCYERSTTKFFLAIRGVGNDTDLTAADWDLIDLAARVDEEVAELRHLSERLVKSMNSWAADLGRPTWGQTCPLTNGSVTEMAFRSGKLDGTKETLFRTLRRISERVSEPGAVNIDARRAAFTVWREEIADP